MSRVSVSSPQALSCPVSRCPGVSVSRCPPRRRCRVPCPVSRVPCPVSRVPCLSAVSAGAVVSRVPCPVSHVPCPGVPCPVSRVPCPVSRVSVPFPQALSCPALSALPPLSPPAALRLLCAPSARRLRLLEWLCQRAYPPFAARLETLQDGPEDARLRELAKLGAELLLCRADDTALLQGTAPPERQLQFIEDLLDAAPPPGDGSGGSPRSSHATLSRSRQLLHQVLETPEGGAALSPPPLPTLPLAGGCSPPRRPPRSCSELEAALGGAQRDLELLEAQSPELGGSPGAPPPVLRLLGVAGGDLGALAAAFGAGGAGRPPGAARRGGAPRPRPLRPPGPAHAPEPAGARAAPAGGGPAGGHGGRGDTAWGGPPPSHPGEPRGRPAAAIWGRPRGGPPGLTPPGPPPPVGVKFWGGGH
ncbi:hypothetical protein Q9966_016478 [Columba livia]|nr:hypothetical protein Q9966_016478 [Columba livia]